MSREYPPVKHVKQARAAIDKQVCGDFWPVFPTLTRRQVLHDWYEVFQGVAVPC